MRIERRALHPLDRMAAHVVRHVEQRAVREVDHGNSRVIQETIELRSDIAIAVEATMREF